VRTLIAGSAAARGASRRRFIDALAEVAERSPRAAFRAQVLQLPGEADIAREIGRDVDPDAIAAARNRLRAAIAERIGARLTRLVDSHAPTGPVHARCRRPAGARSPTPRST
jgi:aminopeptidase N